MNRQKLTELVLQPHRISNKESSLLQDMAAQYPYATVIQILLAKSKQQQSDAREHLATAALYTPNRGVLRQLMEDKLPFVREDGSNKAQSLASEQIFAQPGAISDTSPEINSVSSGLPEHSLSPEQAPQLKSDVFEELQQNLKRMRREREKMNHPHSSTATSETAGAAASTITSTGDERLRGMHPTLQQLVEEHQQQTLDNPRIQEQRSLIDSFLENAPSLQKRQAISATEGDAVTDLSLHVSNTPPDLATETLARIMERQGKNEKAIDIYQKLVLKYPQKSAYFADCIERLKKDSR